ncbi:MAG: hypothetical protein ABFC94_18450 [Syntrophomonas sp.]
MVIKQLLTLLKQVMKVILTLCSVPFIFVGMILMLYGWIFLIFKPLWLRINWPGGRLTSNPEQKAAPSTAVC